MGMGILQKMSNMRKTLVWWLHRRRLTTAVKGDDREYQLYLEGQLARTLSKRTDILPSRAREFIDRISDTIDLHNCRILCAGCRNTLEIDYFWSKGAGEVVGIDLYSESSSIRVMDMHALSFPDRRFDLLFSSHSLEHAYDPYRAAAEFVRVVGHGGVIAVEVPICFQPQGADLFDFHDHEQLRRLFSPHVGKIFWDEEKPPSENGLDTATIRTMFEVNSVSGGASQRTQEANGVYL